MAAAGMLTVDALSRLTNGTVLACMRKPVGPAQPCAGRLLSRAEIERAAQNAELDLAPEFVASSRNSRCYGVLVDQHVRSYAWATSDAVPAVPETIVRMSPTASYVYKAFTDPSYRRKGLLSECLKAIEQAAVHEGRDQMTALVDVQNRNSLGAFRKAGFDRCGFVVVLRRPWLVRRIGCRSAAPCSWQRDRESVPASALGAAPNELGRTQPDSQPQPATRRATSAPLRRPRRPSLPLPPTSSAPADLE
jgi:GNAT superfamily N-acetyltransferase